MRTRDRRVDRHRPVDLPRRVSLGENPRQHSIPRAVAGIPAVPLPHRLPGTEGLGGQVRLSPIRSSRPDELPHTVTVQSKDTRNKTLPSEDFVLDTRQFASELRITRHGLHEIAESLKKIEGAVSSWTEGLHGLSVYARNGDAKDERDPERRGSRREGRSVAAQANAEPGLLS